MSEAKYTKLNDAESQPATAPPEYAPLFVKTDEEPRAKTHFFKSLLATLFCCFPTGLAALFFSFKTHVANKAGKTERARRVSRIAKKLVIASVVLGTLAAGACLAFHIGFIVREVHVAKHSFKDGLVSGIEDGKIEGAKVAASLISTRKDGESVVLPNPVPSTVNPFDVRKDNPFWAQIIASFEDHRPAEAAKPFGYQFGWMHGYKVGFCGVEGTDCTGVVLEDSPCPFRAVFGGMVKHGRRHHDKKNKDNAAHKDEEEHGEQEGHDNDD